MNYNVWYDDAKMLRLNASEVLAYLRETGWSVTKNQPGKWTLWIKDDVGEILCPLSRDLRDYGRRMAELVHNLAILPAG